MNQSLLTSAATIPGLSAHQRHQFYKRDFRVHLDVEFLVEAFGLFVSDEHKESVSVEGSYRALELFLPINLSFRFQLVAVEDAFCVRRLDEAAEVLRFFQIVVLN